MRSEPVAANQPAIAVDKLVHFYGERQALREVCLEVRRGEVFDFLDQQDEINHRRSKALHANSARQTAGTEGSIPNVDDMKREMAKMDGHVEFVKYPGEPPVNFLYSTAVGGVFDPDDSLPPGFGQSGLGEGCGCRSEPRRRSPLLFLLFVAAFRRRRAA